MSKILKLTGVKTFTSSFTNQIIVARGETCRVTEAIAAKVLKGSRRNAEGEPVAYWTEMPEGSEVTHDFAPAETAPVAAVAQAEVKTKTVARTRQRA